MKRIIAVITLCALILSCGTLFASASEASLDFFIRGDVVVDGVVDARDYVATKRYIFGTMELNEMQRLAADVNQDGVIDARDYIMLKRVCMGTSEFYVETFPEKYEGHTFKYQKGTEQEYVASKAQDGRVTFEVLSATWENGNLRLNSVVINSTEQKVDNLRLTYIKVIDGHGNVIADTYIDSNAVSVGSNDFVIGDVLLRSDCIKHVYADLTDIVYLYALVISE